MADDERVQVVQAAPMGGRLSHYGQMTLANVEFQKGQAFVVAAMLLLRESKNESHLYVHMHLIAQGLELIIKSALLFNNFGKYSAKKKSGYGHKLLQLCDEVISVYKLNPIKEPLRQELTFLHEQYMLHSLRYASPLDIFIRPSSIQTGRVRRRVRAVIYLMNREINRQDDFAMVL